MTIARLVLVCLLAATASPKAERATPYQRMQQKERLDHLGFRNCEALALLDKLQDAATSNGDWVNRQRMEPDRCLTIHAAWETDKTWLVTHDAPHGVKAFDLENDEHPDFDSAESQKINKMFGLVWPKTPTARPTAQVTSPALEPGALLSTDEVTPPKILTKVNPVYPESARKVGKQGVVILQAQISPEGNVEAVSVMRPLDPILDVYATNAVRLWKYSPALKGGKPVRTYLTVTVSFYLRR